VGCTWSPLRSVWPAWPRAHVCASSTSAHSRLRWSRDVVILGCLVISWIPTSVASRVMHLVDASVVASLCVCVCACSASPKPCRPGDTHAYDGTARRPRCVAPDALGLMTPDPLFAVSPSLHLVFWILCLSIATMPSWHLSSVPVALALAVLRPALACAPLCTTHNSSLLLVSHSPSACCFAVARDSTPRIVSIQISGSVVSSSRGHGSIAPHHLLELLALGMAGGAIRRQPLLSPAHVVMACCAVPSLPCSCSITPETRPSVLRILVISGSPGSRSIP